VDAATLGAVGAIVVGLATAAAALIGQRTSARATHQGAVMTGYGGLVDNLQEERDALRTERDALRAELAAAYAELTAERADKAGLHTQIAQLQADIADRDRQIAALGGPTS
jgi:chromosome segregation ATPase